MHLPYQIRRLPITFDAARLAAVVEQIPASWWVDHVFEGTGHQVLLLTTTNGTLKNPDGSDNHTLRPPFLPTPHLEALPALGEVLAAFGVPVSRARLMRIPSNAGLEAHRDLNPHWNRRVRIHVPILTNPGAFFHVWKDDGALPERDHVAVHMGAGEAWIFNTFHYHAVTNASPAARVHLVGDCAPEGPLRGHVFAGCSPEEIAAAESFEYPPYEPDPQVLRWATGGGPASPGYE